MLPQHQGNLINIIPPAVVGQVERKRSLHEEMGAKGLLVKQGSGTYQDQHANYAAGPLPAQRLSGQLPPQGYQQSQFAPQQFQVAGQLPQGLPNVGITPVPIDPFIQKAQGIRPGEGLLYDARGLPLDSQGYLPNTGPTIGQRMRDAAHIGEPNGQPNYVDVHSISTSSIRTADHAPVRQDFRERELIRDQVVLPPQQFAPQGQFVQQQGQFVQQQGQFVQQQGQFVQPQGQFVQPQGQFIQQQQAGFVAGPQVVPVKGVGVMDKLYMGAHNLKEHVKDKIYAHQETKQVKKMAEAEMKAEEQALKARQYTVEAQLEAERKALLMQQDTVVGGLKHELTAERAAFEQKQAAIQAQLEAERQEFLRQQEHKIGGIKSQFDAQKAVIEGKHEIVESQLERERRLLREQQDAAAQGLKFELENQKRAIIAEGRERRAVENQMFVNQVMAEHTADAIAKENILGLKGERHVLEATLAQQAAMEKAAVKDQVAFQQEAIKEQAWVEGQQQAAFAQQQAQQQFIRDSAQPIMAAPVQAAPVFVQSPPVILEKETRIIREEAVPTGSQRLQGYGQQAVAGVQSWANTAVNNTNSLMGQATNATNNIERRVESAAFGGLQQGAGYIQQGQGLQQQGGQFVDQFGNTVERRVSNDVNKIHGGQEFIQKERDIVRDASGRVIADAKNLEKDTFKETRHGAEVKHEEHHKVNERI